ncbi:MAG: hypothetical protein KJO65_10230, partial [Gemmatimonadetes bacterium]|nr:hypothetical protein [Gemmatimonadota bacterium]
MHSLRPAAVLSIALFGVVGSGAWVAASGQDSMDGSADALPIADESEVIDEARRAQARFENRRIRHLPVSYSGFGGPCDEVVGRICVG